MPEKKGEPMMRIDDGQSRKDIVDKLGENFFVEASAGSGKTTSLVYRMVALVEREGVPVEQICTITFTKAAADEFFSRFQALLSMRSQLRPDESDEALGEKTPKTVERCQKALANIDSCFLGTIDAFCNMIAHELPAELGIPSDSEVIGMDEYVAFIEEANLRILKDDAHPLHQKALRFRELIYPSQEGLSAGVKAFLEMRHTEIPYDSALASADLEAYFKDDKAYLLPILQGLVGLKDCYNPDRNDNKNKKYRYQRNLATNLRILKGKNWNECPKALGFALEAVLKMDGFSKNALNQGLGFILELPTSNRQNAVVHFTDAFQEDIVRIQDKLNEYKYSVYCDYVDCLSKEMEGFFKEHGKFQFFDFLYYLNEAFKRSAATDRQLLSHILGRHSRFLLDESQDTNPLQTELFFRLTGTVNDPDWRNAKPRPGSLFIVGDPKQSIYSFRDANVSAYLGNKAIFEKEGQVLVLTRNFRSNVRLRRWFNATMNGLLDHGAEALTHLDIPISKEEEEAERIPDGVLDGVYTYACPGKDDGEQVARIILALVGKEKIYSKAESRKPGEPKKKERTIRYSDFLIVPRSTDASKIVASLNQYHIPVAIEAQIPFRECESLMAAKDLLLLLASPENTIRLLNVLYGPLYRFDEKDVIALLNAGFDLNLAHPATLPQGRLKEAVEELTSLFEAAKGMSYSSAFLYTLNSKDLHLLDRVSSSHLEYAYFLMEKIKEAEEAALLANAEQLDAFLTRFLEGKDDQRSLRFRDKLDRVKVSNVHKVKGLQAPIVILAKPRQGKKAPTKYVDFSLNPPKTYFSEFSGQQGFLSRVYAKTKAYEGDLPRWEESAKAESERLEYVAATRAESVLIIGAAKLDSDEINPWGDLFAAAKPEYGLGELPLDPPVIPDPVPLNVPLGDDGSDPACHEATYQVISPSQMRMRRIDDNLDDIDDARTLEKEKKDATLLGTLVHRLMELIVSSKNAYPMEEAVAKALREQGVCSEEYKGMLCRIAHAIQNGGFPQKNSILKDDILSTLLHAERVWCETPFSYLSKAGNVVHGIIDLLYLDKEGRYHLIDYKTNEEDDVARLEKEYEAQLSQYVYALKKRGIDADAHIYHIPLHYEANGDPKTNSSEKMKV